MTTLRNVSKNWHNAGRLVSTPAAGPTAHVQSRSLHQPAGPRPAQYIRPLQELCSSRALSYQKLHLRTATPYHPKFSPPRETRSYSTATVVPEEPTIHNVFDTKTGTWQYLVADPSTMTAVIIDPVLDYDATTQAITTEGADAILALVNEKGYKIDKILETHAHADHLTAASYLQSRVSQQQEQNPPICIGKRIGKVQKLFSQRYGIPANECEGVFDKLFEDDEELRIGNLKGTAIHLPGHTPDHLGYKIGDNIFCGDSIFHADIGTARCDFPGGSARDLYKSAHKLLKLPENVKIWTGHDYPPDGRGTPEPYMTVKDHKAQNKHLLESISEDDFVALRKERDASLAAPKLLHPSLQVNIRAGRLPKPTESGHRLLHLPLKLGGLHW